jgi:hypothetical protein
MSFVLAEVSEERDAQDAKWGEQNHPDGTNLKNDDWRDHARRQCQTAAAEGRLTWAHILQEEFVEALAEEDPEKLRAELIQVAAVAVAWAEAIDRRLAKEPPLVPSETVHEYFGLSYANYLVLARSLMQSMPDRWQQKVVAVLREYHAAFGHIDIPDYNVSAGKWCYLSDLSDSTLDELGIKSTCADQPPDERIHELLDCYPGECTYRDRDGDEIDHQTASVFVPGKDPVPHYNRGRTRVPRADQLAKEGQS